MAVAKRKPPSSSNSAFHALGLAGADDLVLRADLMQKIGSIIAARELTQAQAAALMGMDQPRVSALLTGKITKFSTDRLLKALSDLGPPPPPPQERSAPTLSLAPPMLRKCFRLR